MLIVDQAMLAKQMVPANMSMAVVSIEIVRRAIGAKLTVYACPTLCVLVMLTVAAASFAEWMGSVRPSQSVEWIGSVPLAPSAVEMGFVTIKPSNVAAT